MAEPEPWRWFVKGDMVVTAEHNAVVTTLRKGDSPAAREAKLEEAMVRQHDAAGTLRLAVKRAARGKGQADDRALDVARRARAAQGLDPITGQPRPVPTVPPGGRP